MVTTRPRVVGIRLTPAEYSKLLRLVKASGITLSQYVRRQLFTKER